MQNFIPENTIADIRNASDIVDVVSDAVMLKKSGKDFLGLCPFHSEKTPSFTVSPEKQIFYCFGCGAGGNVFNFLMKNENLSFPEAARVLAGRCGIEIPVGDMTPEQKRRIDERERIYEINREALLFYRDSLLQSEAGAKARSYLERRGITAETAEHFQLGYAPSAWDSLLNVLTGKKIPPSLPEKAGLTVPRKNGSGYYDRFRDRIMFPITDERNRVIAFGGRVLDDSLPKYLNSPETPVFSKGSILYGLAGARQSARENGNLYMVEGYFDVISLHRHGIRNCVATMGTALTGDHLRILKRYAKEIILVFDSDPAGLRAAKRSIDLFRQEKTDARILVLPEGEDPDSYVRKSGAEAFIRLGSEAQAIMKFLLEEAVKKHGLSVEGKIRIIGEMQEPLSTVHDPVASSLYIRELAECIGVDEAMIREKLRQGMPRVNSSEHPAQPPPPASFSGRSIGRYRIEQKIIAMIIQFPEIIPEISEREILGHFENHELRSAGEIILSVHSRSSEPGEDENPEDSPDISISGLMNRTENIEIRRIIASLAMEEDIWNREGCLSLLAQFERGKKHSVRLLQEIETASRENNQALLIQLLQEKQNQARERLSTT